MGFAFMYSECPLCGGLFASNPLTVPSVRIRLGVYDPTAEREAICRGCMDALNRLREDQGLEPISISPDAYEPTEELG